MNTTEAAAAAGVTIPTIRTWCRIGAIAAVKQAGRWVIDERSLRHRIAIGAMRAARRKATVTLDYTALAAEARALVDRLTPKRGCHPADRIGGARDRASGTHRARNLATSAAREADLAAQAAADGRAWDAREHHNRATEYLAAARTAADNIRRIG